jgi:hypothetical protein
MSAADIKESDLYEPVRAFLAERGYAVNSEVLHCDITAVRGEELVVVELKRSFSLALITQAVERQRSADSVYVAVPRPKGAPFGNGFRDMVHLLKRLELGLLLVDLSRPASPVELFLHPRVYEARRDTKRRRAIIREIGGRSMELNVGGSAPGSRVTAYRENALQIACYLAERGPLSPRQLRDLGTGTKTQAILSRNVYGWFDRVERGVYRVHDSGREALKQYPQLTERYRVALERNSDAQLPQPEAPGRARRRTAADRSVAKSAARRTGRQPSR